MINPYQPPVPSDPADDPARAGPGASQPRNVVGGVAVVLEIVTGLVLWETVIGRLAPQSFVLRRVAEGSYLAAGGAAGHAGRRADSTARRRVVASLAIRDLAGDAHHPGLDAGGDGATVGRTAGSDLGLPVRFWAGVAAGDGATHLGGTRRASLGHWCLRNSKGVGGHFTP